MRARRGARRLLGWAAAGVLAAGCGYRTGLLVPDDVQTIGVRLFHNDSKQRDLERELHVWLSDSVQRLVGATLVDPRRADLVLEGRLLDYSRRSGIRSPDNKLLETGVRIALEARLVRPGAGAVAAQDAAAGSRAEKGSAGAIPGPSGAVLWRRSLSQEFGFRLDEAGGESRARERALRSLADRIVLEAFSQLAEQPPDETPNGETPNGETPNGGTPNEGTPMEPPRGASWEPTGKADPGEGPAAARAEGARPRLG